MHRRTRWPMTALLAMAVTFASQVHAMKDKDNQGRWEKPTENNAPDKEVPGFLVNLGPTGARAILTDRTFIVKYLFKDSPAVSKLKLNDVIAGAFGKPFGIHTFGGGPHGYEGPIMDLGEAIERAEGKDGKLVLNVQRGSEKLDVTIDLEPIGTFGATFPVGCRKSELLRERALKYLAEHPDAQNVWQSHARMAVTLALLTSDDPKQFAAGKSMALKWSGQKPDAGTWTWNLSHQLIALSEYHLLTRDAAVLPTVKILVGALEKAQYSGKIVVWQAKPGEDASKIDAAQQLYDGGFGHAPYVPGVGKDGGYGPNGYGPMQYTTILAVTAWQLAARCGVEAHPDSIRRALDFIHRGTNAAGYVAYGGEFTLNNGLVDPVAWKKSRSGDNYAGRAGCSIVAHKLSPEFADSVDYADKNQRYLERAYKSMPDGHADSNLGLLWGPLGAAASGDDKVLRVVLDYHKAFFNMMRCHDGSFVLLPGRDYADDGYYMASRYHPTGTMALVYGLGNPKLLIQGIQVCLPGVNPKALKGRMDTAYRAIVRKSFAEAAAALKNPGPEDTAVATAMLNYLDAQAQQSVATLEALEKTGDILRLQAELARTQKQFGLLPGFQERVARFEEGFRQDAWKLELKLGANYRQLVDALKRNRSAAYAGDLERFAEKHPDSLYGKWALEVAKEYRASGALADPSARAGASESTASAAPVVPLAPGALPATVSSAPPAKVSNAAPQPTPAPSKTSISPEALASWQARLAKKLDELARTGRKLKLDLGDQRDYLVRGANENTLIVNTQGNDLPMPWRMLSPAIRASLASSAAADDDPESLLIAAVFQLEVGRTEQAETLFAKAALKDAEAARMARSSLEIAR